MSSSRGSSPSPLSSAIIEGNDDLLIEILLFLPAKSLLTFKTVSKRWRSLIFDPLFCRRHTLHHPLRRRETQTLLLTGSSRSKYVVCDPTTPKLYPSQLQFGFPWVHVMQSCNGLLLLRSNEGGGRYYVFNPITMQKREVSPLPEECYYHDLFLMFDPYLSPHYKVVCFASTKKGSLVYLYKSEAREWSKLVGEAIQMKAICSGGFYFNGGICFHDLRCTYRFTPDDCKLTKISDIPNHGRRWRYERSCVMESNGVVFCLTRFWKDGVNLLTVCEMETEMETEEKKRRRWRKKYEVDMNPIIAKCGVGECCEIQLMGMVRAEKEEEDYVLMFRVRFRGEVMIYRFSDGGVEDFDCFFGVSHNFIGTLAPV